MSDISTFSLTSPFEQNELFTLTFLQNPHHLEIEMKLLTPVLHTNAIPHVVQILKQIHPAVLRTRCFNPDNLPFAMEVKNTEIGHLFEHILLAYLTELKNDRGIYNSVFNGMTKWNWTEDAQGVFYITIDAGMRDSDILPKALEKSVDLLTFILTEGIGRQLPKTKQTAN